MIADTAAGRMPAYVDTGLNIAHVDDVAEGHVLALERGRIGECYILGGEDMGMQRLLALVGEVAGRAPPRVKLPHAALYPLALGERGAGPGCRDRADSSPATYWRWRRKKMFFSSAKAEAELGYRSRPAREAVADAVAWFRANGRVAGMTAIALLALATWVYLLAWHGRFWSAGPSLSCGAARSESPAGRHRGAGA